MPPKIAVPEPDFTFDPIRYAEDLLADSEVSEEERAAVMAALSKPRVTSRLQNSVVMRSAAQSMIDRARNAAQKAEEMYEANVKYKADAEAEIARIRSQQPQSPFSQPPAPPAHPAAPSGDYISKADLDRILAETSSKFEEKIAFLDNAYVGFSIDVADLAHKHRAEYNEPLPLKELTEFARERGMRLTDAWPIFTIPQANKKREDDFNKAIAKAKEEGRLEALSEMGEPHAGELGRTFGRAAEQTTPALDVLTGRRRQTLDDKGAPQEGEEAFIRSWNRTQGFTRPDPGTGH